MGRASRWLRSLLGAGKKDAATGGNCEVKRRWSFAKSPRQVPPAETAPAARGRESPASALELAWLRSFYEDGEEGSKHAVAVAVATAAAANAAVTAAQAAMVRLKSLSGERTAAYGSYEQWSAAVRIQTAFRCYLARKALRALKGLVKLQALVRGFLVRKQAAMTLRKLQALVRAQYAARSREFSRRRSFEKLNDRIPKNLETDSFRSKSKSFRRTSSSNLNAPEEIASSPLLHKVPPRLSIPSSRSSDDHRTSPRFRTAQNTPRLRPATPARSFFPTSPSSCPNYMVSTTSFVAKARAGSAPKQRPEKLRSPRKKAEVGGGRSPLRGWEGYDVKHAMEGKLERSPMALRREAAMDYYYLSDNW